jgi:hypothetical protein
VFEVAAAVLYDRRYKNQCDTTGFRLTFSAVGDKITDAGKVFRKLLTCNN